MKYRKIIAALLPVTMVLALFAGVGAWADTEYVNYLDMSNWAIFAEGEDKPVDVFLIAPTVDTQDEYNMSLSDEKMKQHTVGALNMQRGIYEDSARLFAPYYRQASMKAYGLPAEEMQPYLDIAYGDVSNAFAWYLAHKNKGRPIILAGFSEGAYMCFRLLEDYFGEDVALKSFDESVNWGDSLMEQLVAAYALGWSCTQEMTEKYPQLRPAAGPDDIGVVISFDCEAPEVTDTYVNPVGQKALSIKSIPSTGRPIRPRRTNPKTSAPASWAMTAASSRRSRDCAAAISTPSAAQSRSRTLTARTIRTRCPRFQRARTMSMTTSSSTATSSRTCRRAWRLTSAQTPWKTRHKKTAQARCFLACVFYSGLLLIWAQRRG